MPRGSSATATATASVSKAKKDLSAYLKKLDRVPTEILEDERQKLYGDIIAETPFHTGRLEESVRVRVAKDKRRPGINASASARDPRTGYNYAGIQHENPNYSHPIKGKYHYIKDPFDRMVQRVVRKTRKALKPGG